MRAATAPTSWLFGAPLWRRCSRRAPCGCPAACFLGLRGGIRGTGESRLPVCGPMMATPSAPFTLLKVSSTTPLPASLSSFSGDNLGHFGWAAVAPVAAHPSWRRSWLGGGGVGHRFRRPALASLCQHQFGCTDRYNFGGCFAALLVEICFGWMLCRLARSCSLGGCFATYTMFGRMLCRHSCAL